MFSEPAVGKDFFGRAEEKNILKERTKAFKSGFRQNIAILGPHLIGKSSLIKNFLIEFSQEEIIFIYVETAEEPFYFFAHRFIGSLLYQYLKFRGVEIKKDDLKLLMKHCKKTLPKTLATIEKIEIFLNKKDFDHAYDSLLDLPRLVEVDSGRLCVVILEEFDKLSNYKLNQPFSTLGKKMMAQRNTFYIVTSSAIKNARQILSEKLQLLFGNFETLELKEFDFPTSRNFLLTRFESFNVADKYLRFLIHFTDGHPFYLDSLSKKLKELLVYQKKRVVTTALLHQLLAEALFNSSGQLYQHFLNLISRQYSYKNGVDSLSLLASLSDGNHRFQYLADSLKHSPKNISRALSFLINAGLVEKLGILTRIKDPVLRFWLKSVYYKRRMDFTSDPLFRQKAFKAQINKFSIDFAKSSKEDLYEKVVDLFKSFRNEVVLIGQKKHRLPTFSDVATRIIGESGPYIIGHSNGKNWICQIRGRNVTERHISDFLKDTKIGKYKFHRKMLIVLADIDENAKLLAKGCGVWVWNLKTLNLLLDLYGKYKVIRY